MAAPLQPKQFVKKDPSLSSEKATFSGGSGSKTMRVERPKGLPKAQKRHKHRDHAGVRSKRAIQNKKKQRAK
jgi:hypothetical protein